MRKLWADYAKGIGAICVVMWHMEFVPSQIKAIFAPWFLTIFFFVSGYFHKDTKFKIWITKRYKNLLIPYILLGGYLLIVYSPFVFGKYQCGILEAIKYYIIQISGRGDYLWFVPCLFITDLFLYIYVKLFNKFGLKTLLFCVLLLSIGIALTQNNIHLPWHIETACIAILYMALGFHFQRHEKKLETFLISNNKYKLWAIIEFILAYIFLLLLSSKYSTLFPDIHLGNYGIFLLYFPTSIIGTVIVIIFSKIFEELQIRANKGVIKKFLGYLGYKSILIYSFQVTGISVFRLLIVQPYMLWRMDSLHPFGIMIISIAFVLLFCIALIKVYEFVLNKIYKIAGLILEHGNWTYQ